MRITSLRNKEGKKLETNEMLLLKSKLKHAIAKAGFITHVSRVNGSSVNISNGGCSFVIDVNKLGYNARVNDITVKSCKAGYKRTHTPTWTQREEFNHVINNVLDALKFSANIKSGDYIVRSAQSGRVNQWDMPEPFHNGYRLQVPSVLEVVPLKYAEDAVANVNVNAPFMFVPETTPRGLPRAARLRLVKSA